MKLIKITYTNHRNETAERIIEPMSIWYGKTEWHPQEQWFLKAKDVERNVRRDFAMEHIAGISRNDLPGDLVDNDIKLPEQSPADTESSANTFDEAKLYADGGSRGNPGPSASGFVILDMEDNVVKKDGIYVGITTNNQAEYKALEAGLRSALELGVKKLHVYMDSLLVVNQVRGIWKIKNADFLPVYNSIHESMRQFEHISLTHVPRALNSKADAMVNECLDAR
jgi:ribonuclease HI